MHLALLSEKLSGSAVRCNICQWRCTINPDKTGVCAMYKNIKGVLYNLNYAKASSIAADPIEKKPLFHFHPGTQVFSLGSWGCNFHCEDCQNWQIAMVKDIFEGAEEIPPQRAIDLAKRYHCAGIAWTYNEPSMWFEYTLDCARLAKQQDLYTVYVTNGYLTPEALDIIGPYLDVWRVDVKGFSDAFYQNLAKVNHWRAILEVAQRAKHKWHMHVEVVTNIIPTLNDDDAQLTGIAEWIAKELGTDTPWHVTRFHPNYHAEDLQITPVATLEHAHDIGLKAGLKFVYLGNVPGHDSENTRCPECGKSVVIRSGYDAAICGLKESCCAYCGADLNFKVGKGGT